MDRHPYGCIGTAQALFALGQKAEAIDTLEKGALRYPTDVSIRAEFARFAENDGDIDEAAKRWDEVMRRFPRERIGYIESIRLFCTESRWSDAESVATAAISRFSKDQWPFVEYASIALRCHDWPAAATRWAAMREALPDDPTGYQRGIEALEAAGEADAATLLRGEYTARFGH